MYKKKKVFEMIKEINQTDLAMDSNVRKAFYKVQKDLNNIKKRLEKIESCQHCKYTERKNH